jgi:hypothetical protein
MTDAEVLKEAIRSRRGKETLEQAVGRAVRNCAGKYEDYMRIMADVRDLAEAKGITVEEAAKELANQP